MNNNLPSFLAGFGACLLTVALGVFLYNYDWSGKPEPKPLQLEEAISTIRAKRAKEVIISGNRLELIDISGGRFVSELGEFGDNWELIYKAAEGTLTKVTLRQRPIGIGQSLFGNSLPLAMLISVFATLSALVFIVWRVTKQVEK